MTLKMTLNVCNSIWPLLVYLTVNISGLGYAPNAVIWNNCASQDHIYAVFYTQTLVTCIEECLGQPDCVAVNYHRLHGACRLVRGEGTPYTCPGYILIQRANMNTDPSIVEGASDPVCQLEALVTAYDTCTMRGNRVVSGSKVRLECFIRIHHCIDSVFVCGQDGQWDFEKCIQLKIVNTVQASYPPSGYTNIARGKPVQLSIQWGEISPGTLLVDGNRRSSWPCASTRESANPSMLVDLGQLFTISHMFIVNRNDCCGARLHDVRILLGPSIDSLREYVYIPGSFGPIGTIELLAPVTTRYVKITILGAREFLTICEFEAWNAATSSP